LEKIVDTLKTAYGDKAAVGFWGATSKPDRADAKHRIQQDDNTRFIVANQSVGGEGNTWTAANLTVYFANSRKNKDRQQSEDRTHRPVQTQSCTYVDLRARRTVDERWVDAIRNKMDLAAALTGDAWRKWLV
jgi:SNF2 family DNA or RNA helicase